ncbi:MAG TPA: YfiR family protein [Planctomycetota bacterium]|nr:YfiR family protein [Planctomycetota bacterium]
MNGRKGVIAAGLAALLVGALRAETPPLQAAAMAQDPQPESDIKAAFLPKFAMFTTWPESVFAGAGDEFRIGVLGPDSALEPVERVLRGIKVGTRTVKVLRGATAAEIKDCPLVFIHASEKERFAEHLLVLRTLPVLTVGESEGFAQGGGILNFYVEQNRVKFEINPEAAARAGLKVTKLVGVAPRKVKDP